MGEFLQRGNGLVDLVREAAELLLFVVQHDLCADAPRAGSMAAENLGAFARLRTRQAEIVGVHATEGVLQGVQRSEPDQPDHDDDDEVTGTPLTESLQPPRAACLPGPCRPRACSAR